MLVSFGDVEGLAVVFVLSATARRDESSQQTPSSISSCRCREPPDQKTALAAFLGF